MIQTLTNIGNRALHDNHIQILLLFIFFVPAGLIGQNLTQEPKAELIDGLIDSIWVNPTSFFNKDDPNWYLFCQSLQLVDATKMNRITHSIYTDSVRGEIIK